MEEYYFPDIIKEVVQRVSDFFSSQDDDPFEVDYDRGIYVQVGNDRLKKDLNPLFIWLVFPFTEDTAKDLTYSSDVICNIIIGIQTDSNYSMDQREEINIFPRLIPVLNKFIEELKDEPKLLSPEKIASRKRILPYWGGNDTNGPGQPNIWENFIDAIELSNIAFKKAIFKECTPLTNI